VWLSEPLDLVLPEERRISTPERFTVTQSLTQRYVDHVIGFRLLASVGAAMAAIAPAIMASAQGAKLEGSISAYWDVDPDYYFWGPFTLAAVLLILDGLISISANSERKYRNRWFNIVLGISLLLLTWFNKDDSPVVHYTAAAVFFVLFIAVIGYTAILGLIGRHLGDDDPAGDERLERASAKVSGVFFGLLILTFVAWVPGLITFYFFEVFALLNFALFHIQGSVNAFPYHHYEFKMGWLNRILRSLRIMAEQPAQG